MSESSKRRLMAGKKNRQQNRLPRPVPPTQQRAAPEPTSEELDHMTMRERVGTTVVSHRREEAAAASPERIIDKAAGKRPVIDLEEGPMPKRARTSDAPRAIFSAEDEELMVEGPVNIACPPKAVQFANHMILGSQMDLEEIGELPKRALREEAGRAFRLQASASMDMWLCVKRAINAAERAKRANELGQSKVAEAAKILQENANLVKDKEALQRQLAETEERLALARSGLEAAVRAAADAEAAKVAVQASLEKCVRSKDAEIQAAVAEGVANYRSSEEFSVLLDKEVGAEMVDLVYRFKRFNPGQKLNLNFAADPPPLPEGITEDMIEDYEGEDAETEASADA